MVNPTASIEFAIITESKMPYDKDDVIHLLRQYSSHPTMDIEKISTRDTESKEFEIVYDKSKQLSFKKNFADEESSIPDQMACNLHQFPSEEHVHKFVNHPSPIEVQSYDDSNKSVSMNDNYESDSKEEPGEKLEAEPSRKKLKLEKETEAVSDVFLAQNLARLKYRTIDSTKCSPQKSLHQQILSSTHPILGRQTKQFNLGNAKTFEDPLQAADYLLEREYGETFLFNPNKHDPLFIPPVFTGWREDSLLGDDIVHDILRTMENLKSEQPNYWFTKELESFLLTQNIKSNSMLNGIQFEHWTLNVKVMYLILKEIDEIDLPPTISDNFIGECKIRIMPYINTTNSEIYGILSSKSVKKEVNRVLGKSPSEDPILSWFFNSKLWYRGVRIEQWLYNQLHSIKNDDILQDIVILSSPTFLKNISKKMHYECDFLIISWERKLIIGVEVKMRITSSIVFEQINRYHNVLEEYFGDQLGPGWTFFPAICVEENDTLPDTQHIISMDTDIKLWLESTLQSFPTIQQNHSLDQLKNILRIIVFTIHASTPITSSNLVDYMTNVIESIKTKDNIVFYSSNQLQVFSDSDFRYNRLVVCGGFSTGKSFLLQEKARLLSQDGFFKDHIMYVCQFRHSEKGSLFYWNLKSLLDPHGIIVRTTRNGLDEDIMKFISMNNIKALFLDEWDIHKETIDRLPNCVEYIWIAPNASNLNEKKEEQLQDEFEILRLSLNLRNSESIVKTSKYSADERYYRYPSGLSATSRNLPRGPDPVFTESVPHALHIARKSTKKGILVVADIINEKNVITLVDEIRRARKDENVKVFRSQHCSNKESSNPCDILKEGGILVTDSLSVSGFEWPVIIFLANNAIRDASLSLIEGHESDVAMRCTTHYIMVNYKEKASAAKSESCDLTDPSTQMLQEPNVKEDGDTQLSPDFITIQQMIRDGKILSFDNAMNKFCGGYCPPCA
ncbi:uncharacterized protein [Clytia hemisphaerica]